MELRDAIKILRQELGVTQLELATALHVTTLTVSRWELGKSRPNRAVTSLLLGYAYTHNVKRSTMDMLKASISYLQKKANQDNVFAGSMAVEHSSLAECIEVSPFQVYVCDIKTDELLYANKMALKMMSLEDEPIAGQKCYNCLMHRDSACDFCHKEKLSKDEFTLGAVREALGKTLFFYGKLIRWNGHDAHIQFVISSDKQAALI